jgi:C4-dicarboxylate-specific signal transduction histidine kinase
MNASMVQSVIINLLRNALDAVESKTGEKRVEIELSEKGGTAVEIVVRDSGTGINPAQLNNLFLPFFTTKGSQNTGMGLFLVQSIVRDMGGKIGVDVSNSMGGATFKVSLPSSKGAVAGGAGRV